MRAPLNCVLYNARTIKWCFYNPRTIVFFRSPSGGGTGTQNVSRCVWGLVGRQISVDNALDPEEHRPSWIDNLRGKDGGMYVSHDPKDSAYVSARGVNLPFILWILYLRHRTVQDCA